MFTLALLSRSKPFSAWWTAAFPVRPLPVEVLLNAWGPEMAGVAGWGEESKEQSGI